MNEEIVRLPKGLLTPEQAIAIYNNAEDILKDLQHALKLVQKYQRNLSMLGAPDPEIVDARNLLRKYGMAYQGWVDAFRVLVDGVDITEHPDSIPGTVASVEEIEDAEVIKELPRGDE